VDVVVGILRDFWGVLTVMSPYLLFGFLAAGLLSQLISQPFVERHLGGRGIGPVLKAAAFGVPLPLCSCGVIPVSASLRRHGAGKGATAAFLISTPQTGVDSIFVTYALLGGVIAIFRPVAALVSGVIGGLLVDALEKPSPPVEAPRETPSQACRDARANPMAAAARKGRWLEGFRYGFVTLPADIGRAMLVGLGIAALISALVPPTFFTEQLGGILSGGIVSMLVMLALGLPMYVCATASVPLAWALMDKGVSPGAALVFLMTGPATNAATIAVLWRVLGRRSAIIYLATVAGSALAAGGLLDLFFSVTHTSAMAHSHWMIPEWFNAACAVVLLGVLAHALLRGRRAARFPLEAQAPAGLQRVRLGISGMTCSHCSSAVQRALLEVPGVRAVRVDLKGGSAQVDWDRPPQEAVALARAVEVLGYNVTATEVGDAGP
jgi:hypothetical protein